MYTLPQNIEAAGTNVFFTLKVLQREKIWKEGLNGFYGVD